MEGESIELRKDAEQSRLELYERFEAEYRGYLGKGAPFALLVFANAAVGVCALTGNQEAARFFAQPAVWAINALAAAPTFPFFLKSMRHDDELRRIAVQIAQSEGRNPQTIKERVQERSRAEAILGAVSKIGPGKIQSDAVQIIAAMDEGWFHTSKGRQQIEDHFGSAKERIRSIADDAETRKAALETVLKLTKRKWEKVAKNPKEPGYQRDYAKAMLSEITAKLQRFHPLNKPATFEEI